MNNDFLNFLKSRYKSYMFLDATGNMNEYEQKNFNSWSTVPINNTYPTDFKYSVNEYGFRDSELLTDVDICFYGCSITFGYGVHHDARWTSIVSKNLKSNNFGVNGLGINEIANLFVKTSQIVKMKQAVILLPNLHRATMLINGEYMPVHVHYSDNVNKDIYKNYWSLPDSYFIDLMNTNIQYINYIAELKNIQVFYSSWDDIVYNELANYNRVDKFPENDRLGRDGTHPGIESHKKFADSLGKHLWT